MHACALAEELGISTIVIPAHPGVLSAAGLLGAPVEHEVAAAFPHALAALNIGAMAGSLRELDARCGALMAAEGVCDATVLHFADVCYIGQSYHLEVPLTIWETSAIYDAFLAAHVRVYGHSPPVPAKIVNLRTVHRSQVGSVATGATAGREIRATTARSIRVASGSVEAAIWHRDSFTPATVVPGPAIIEQSDTTTLVEPGWTARLSACAALLLERTP